MDQNHTSPYHVNKAFSVYLSIFHLDSLSVLASKADLQLGIIVTIMVDIVK